MIFRHLSDQQKPENVRHNTKGLGAGSRRLGVGLSIWLVLVLPWTTPFCSLDFSFFLPHVKELGHLSHLTLWDSVELWVFYRAFPGVVWKSSDWTQHFLLWVCSSSYILFLSFSVLPLCIHSFCRCLLNLQWVPVTAPGVGDAAVNKETKSLPLKRSYNIMGGDKW